MKRFTTNLSLTLLMMLGTFSLSGQKLSYSLLVNESASLDDTYSICIYQTTGGECLDLERNWKMNVTAAVNYELNKRMRLQSGLAYNVLSLDKVNEALERDAYKIKYLSIPVRTHYFINQGKVSFYTGAGLRTDIRLNEASGGDLETPVQDNGRSIALSMELMAGLEVKVLPQLSLNIEPIYSKGITSYSKDLQFGSNVQASFFGIQMMPEYPQRLGINLGFTYRLVK